MDPNLKVTWSMAMRICVAEIFGRPRNVLSRLGCFVIQVSLYIAIYIVLWCRMKVEGSLGLACGDSAHLLTLSSGRSHEMLAN